MNRIVDRDRKVVLIVAVLLAVALLATICSLSISGPERQVRRRWDLTESQINEIKQLIEKYRRGEISLTNLELDMLSKFREWNIIPPPHIFLPDMEIFYTIKSIISTVNVALIIILLLIYLDIYRKTRIQFTIGLIIFSLILLFYALSSNPFMQMLFGFRAFGLGPFAMLPDIFAFTALIVLLYISLK